MFHFINGLLKFFFRFINNDRGVTSIEYALIVSLITLTILLSASSLGSVLNNAFSNISYVVSTTTEGGSSGNPTDYNGNNGNK